MLTMDTGKKVKKDMENTKKTSTARDRREPKAWISCKAPTAEAKAAPGEQPSAFLPTPWAGPRGKWKMQAGAGRIL